MNIGINPLISRIQIPLVRVCITVNVFLEIYEKNFLEKDSSVHSGIYRRRSG